MKTLNIPKFFSILWLLLIVLLILGKFWFGDLFATILITSLYLLPFCLFILIVSNFFIFKNKYNNFFPVFILYLVSTILIYYFAYITPFELHIG